MLAHMWTVHNAATNCVAEVIWKRKSEWHLFRQGTTPNVAQAQLNKGVANETKIKYRSTCVANQTNRTDSHLSLCWAVRGQVARYAGPTGPL